MIGPKVLVKRDGSVYEYPLPLPFVPTYREMNLIQKVTSLSVLEILARAGADPNADFAVAIYAIKRANPGFSEDDAEALYDLPFGAIEIHFDEADEVADPDPLSPGGEEPSESSSETDKPETSPSSTSADIAVSGTP
jgi:hypothetical protein